MRPRSDCRGLLRARNPKRNDHGQYHLRRRCFREGKAGARHDNNRGKVGREGTDAPAWCSALAGRRSLTADRGPRQEVSDVRKTRTIAERQPNPWTSL